MRVIAFNGKGLLSTYSEHIWIRYKTVLHWLLKTSMDEEVTK